MKNELVLVVGANGTVGSGIVKILKAEGKQVRTLTSRPVAAQSGTDAGGAVQADLISGKGIREAFEGVTRAFLLSPPGHADQYKVLSPLIQEAKRRGLKKVVLMTALGVNANPASPFRRAELELEGSGVPFNIIRPNWFMQNFSTMWAQPVAAGKLQLPAGQAKTSYIDSRDISAVAAKLLFVDGGDLANQALDLTGSESLTYEQAVALISKSTGKNVAYENIAPATFEQGLLSFGLPADYAALLVALFGFVRDGYNQAPTGEVSRVLGRAPITFAQYATDLRAAWV